MTDKTQKSYTPQGLRVDADGLVYVVNQSGQEMCLGVVSPFELELWQIRELLLAALREFMDVWNSNDANSGSKRAIERRGKMWGLANLAIESAERGEGGNMRKFQRQECVCGHSDRSHLRGNCKFCRCQNFTAKQIEIEDIDMGII